MTKILLPAAMLLILSASALADGATSTFTDPNEQAFTVQVPKGWLVKGGLQRSGPLATKAWMSVTTGDRSTIMFIGDPSIPAFAEPGGRFAPPKDVVVAPYENGQQFAVDYGNKVLPRVCASVKMTGTQPDPEAAQRALAQAAQIQQDMGTNFPAPQIDAGSAMFTCQAQGRMIAARFNAVTARMGTNWNVTGIGGFTTPAGLENKAEGLLTAMTTSMRWNPDWRQRQANAARQQMAQQNQVAGQWQQIISNNAAAGSRMLYNQFQSNMYRGEVSHDAFMQQQESARDSRNAAFAQHMYQKSVGQQNEMMYIQNQQCIHRVYNQPGNACNVYVQH